MPGDHHIVRGRRRCVAGGNAWLHTTLFEAGGLVVVTPLASWLTGHGIGRMGLLTASLATFAMLWNLLWNRLFDHWVPTRRRSLSQRVAQALGFELGLLVMTLPIVAWWLGIGVVEAFWLDLGFMLFFLGYALIFNSTFDGIMQRRLARRRYLMAYVYLCLAIVAEVLGTSALKASQEFTRLWPSVGVVIGYGLAFYWLTLVLRTLPVGIAYAVWAGLGIVLVTLIGVLWFGERLDWPAVAGLAMIIAGVTVIQLFSSVSAH